VPADIGEGIGEDLALLPGVGVVVADPGRGEEELGHGLIDPDRAPSPAALAQALAAIAAQVSTEPAGGR
jgi:hypothetical protein